MKILKIYIISSSVKLLLKLILILNLLKGLQLSSKFSVIIKTIIIIIRTINSLFLLGVKIVVKKTLLLKLKRLLPPPLLSFLLNLLLLLLLLPLPPPPPPLLGRRKRKKKNCKSNLITRINNYLNKLTII